jgi:SOS-response transcriptional repressor LexA
MQQNRASKKQQELLSFVDGFIKGNGYGPSYREIMRALGYKSVSTVAIHIDNLIAKGYLARRDNSARSLEVVTMRRADAGAPQDAQPKPDVEAELTRRIESADLTAEQKEMIGQALELLGFNMPAQAIRTKESNEKSI